MGVTVREKQWIGQRRIKRPARMFERVPHRKLPSISTISSVPYSISFEWSGKTLNRLQVSRFKQV